MAKRTYPFYVVWKGKQPGIYTSWEEVRNQVHGYSGAVYKGFHSLEEAQKAFEDDFEKYIHQSSFNTSMDKNSDAPKSHVQPIVPSICVDASCEGNPGPMEYRGVYTDTKEEIFRVGPYPLGTNNIGEFLAIVHSLAWLKKKNLHMPIYSDSDTAISWVQQKKCKTNLERNSQTEELFQLIDRAIIWLEENPGPYDVRKWITHLWGENPADFGKK